MKSIELKSRQLLRKIFNGISITAVAFIFQACYGMPHDRSCDLKITGKVISKTTKSPIKGITVSVVDGHTLCFTDENGEFSLYTGLTNCCSQKGIEVKFLDTDGAQNGQFVDKKMLVELACKNEVNVYVELEEKQ